MEAHFSRSEKDQGRKRAVMVRTEGAGVGAGGLGGNVVDLSVELFEYYRIRIRERGENVPLMAYKIGGGVEGVGERADNILPKEQDEKDGGEMEVEEEGAVVKVIP